METKLGRVVASFGSLGAAFHGLSSSLQPVVWGEGRIRARPSQKPPRVLSTFVCTWCHDHVFSISIGPKPLLFIVLYK